MEEIKLYIDSDGYVRSADGYTYKAFTVKIDKTNEPREVKPTLREGCICQS